MRELVITATAKEVPFFLKTPIQIVQKQSF